MSNSTATPQTAEQLIADLAARVDAMEGAARIKPNLIQRNAPVLSAFFAFLALAVSSYYYYSAIAVTKSNLANNLVYTMQRDERSALADYLGSKPGADVYSVLAQIQSVFFQHGLGSIPPDVWPAFVSDFCGVMKRENFRRAWLAMPDGTAGAFSNEFVAFMDDITKSDSPTCATHARISP